MKLHGTRYSSDHFYEFCLTDRLKKMYEDYEAPTVVDLVTLSDTLPVMSPGPPKITPRTALIALRGKSEKRLAARSEKKGGGLKATDARKRGAKVRCVLCTKPIAPDNRRHRASKACVKYAKNKKVGPMHSSGLLAAYLRELDHNSDDSVCSFFDDVDDAFEFDADEMSMTESTFNNK